MQTHKDILEEVYMEFGKAMGFETDKTFWKSIALEAMKRLEQLLTQQKEFDKIIYNMPEMPEMTEQQRKNFEKNVDDAMQYVRRPPLSDDYIGITFICSDCKQPMTLVRPGKHQCDNSNCPSNMPQYEKDKTDVTFKTDFTNKHL